MSIPEFIETKGSLERVNKVLEAILSGNPILLEGETGTSKTRTAIVASERNKQKPIVLNFSSQTSIEDIIGRISKDTDSWGGFSFTNGPFTDAFMNGHCLILDEINLAYENVLQCIEAALDSGKLYLEISGSETKVVHKHPNFHLIATQNPLKGRFAQKRQFLSQKFRSRFQTITFVDIKKDELFEIAMGLAKDLPDSENFIAKLIDFHFDWKEKENNDNKIHVFTIREISGTIKSIKNGLSLFESILINYGSRYGVDKLKKMSDMLISLDIKPANSNLILPQFDQNLFYMTKSLNRSLLNSFHLLQNCHPILITGPDGYEIEEEKNDELNTKEVEVNDEKDTKEVEVNDEKDTKEVEVNDGKDPKEVEVNDEKDTKEVEVNDEKDTKEVEVNDEKDTKEVEVNDEKDAIKKEENDEKEALESNKKNETFKSAKKENDHQTTTNVFICNPEVSISDIIGRYTPVMGQVGEAPIQWIDGPVVASLRKGDCLIMDQIDTAPSTILERLNSLYDNFGVKDSKFPVQENSEEESVSIHPNFRIIATSSYEGLSDISPALLNRFKIIYIDDQLAELFSYKNKLIEFIQHLSPIAPQKSDIKLIAEQVIRNREKMTISRISMIVKGFFSIKKTFPHALSKSVLEFCISATSSSADLPKMDENFVSLLLTSLSEDQGDSAFDSFLFKEASATRSIMAVLVASFIAGYHVVLIGKTGLGKTSAAIALSRLCQFSQGRQFISFNGETQLEELFGYFTIEKGNFTSHSGPLSDAMESGKIFIADELNLADQMIIQSLNVAIEPSKNDQIILPVIGRNIVVNERFFFIGCQNDVSMYGRKPLPPQFQKKVLCIKYPENSRTDLLSLTSSLAKQFNLEPKYSQGTTEMIEMMKQNPVFQKKVWSLREVRRLFRRTDYIFNHLKTMHGFTIYTNAAFLLRSAFRDTEDISKKVVDLVSKSFKLSRVQSENLSNDLNADVKIFKIEEKSQIQLRKNRLSITITNSELIKIPEELQSFWQTLFEVGITHPSEPLLLVGPSGFKTFLAKAVCPRSPVVYLHSDTTISSLIGQITLLDKDQAKNFLLDLLFNFAGPAPTDEFQNLFQEIRELEMIDIKKIQEVKKFFNVSSFDNIVDNIIQQIVDIDNQQNLESAFSNYYSIFKPGLITKYILKQNSLILRNIAQPSPTVLERLNELLSITPTLTLFEDTSNTITSSNNKVLSQISNNFRIIGICLPREKRGLSEAMLSRLTEISVPKYTNQDQEKVIDSILLQSDLNKDNSFDLYKKLLKKVSQIFIEQKEELSMTIPFTRIIEIVRISIEWRKFYSKYKKVEKEESLFSLALFRCAAGPLPYEIKKIFLKVFYNEKTELFINDELKKLFDDKTNDGTSPDDFLILYEEENKNVIKSRISNLFMPSPLNQIPNTNFCFTSSTKDMIDVIISASVINYPLILEGPNGTGKSSTLLYLSKCVDANVVRISISSSTTVEDLFGKYEPNTSSKSLKFDFQPTDFLNAIRYHDSANKNFSPLKKQWIIIEELHLASASILESLAPIFNKQTEQIFLTDGQIVAKRDYFIVGLVSQPLQNQSINNSSMIYKVRDYTKSEYDIIYNYILSNNNFSEDICNYFSDQMFILSKLSSTSQSKIPITVREVYKFLNLFEGSEGKMEIDQIIRILCLGRFTNNEFIDNAKAELRYNDDNYKPPTISVEMGTSTLKSDEIPMKINTSTSRSQYEIQYLSSSEKELFVFLSMALKKYTPIIIQGPTASGKTYSIQLFAEIIGKTLRTIQLNSEITSQTISGTFQPSKNLSPDEMEKLQEILHSISDLPNLPQEFAEKIQNDEINNWLPKHFKKLRTILQNTKDELNKTDKEKAMNFIKEVDNLLQFYNHLRRSDSVIIKAMIEGSWLLLDGIEAAPSDFFDRLSTLIDSNPILNLYERGNGFTYSINSSNPDFRIHPDFRLIMTYNPIDLSSVSNLSPSLLSRCTIFSMKSIDNNLNDSSLVIFGFLNQVDFKHLNEESSEVSIKLGKSHMAAKEFTSNSQFSVTGRTLIHLCHNIEYKSTSKDKSNEINYENLKNIIDFIYGSLMDDSSKFLEAVDEKFEQTIDINILEFIKKAQLKTSKGCIEIINLIDNFMIEIKDDMQTQFDFDAFLGWLLQLHLKDVERVYDKIHFILMDFLTHLLSDIKSKNENINAFNKNIFAHFASIKCLEILISDILQCCKNGFEKELSKNATLSSPQVQEIPKFQIILKKIRCILYLIKNGIFIMQSIPIFFYDNVRKEFLSLLENIEEEKEFHEIFASYQKLKNNDETINLINFQENPIYFMDSMKHFYESNNWPPKLNIVSKMIASCIFFNDNKCKYLFKGISRMFYLILESLLNDESEMDLFTYLIDYITLFYKTLEVYSSITLDEFVSLFKMRSDDPKQFNKFFQSLRTINNKLQNQDDHPQLNKIEELKPISNAINSLYQEYNNKYGLLYLQRQKDQDAAKEFLEIVEKINNRLETEEVLKKPLELYVRLTDNMEINSESFNLLKIIYLSIKEPKESNADIFEWPHDDIIKFSNNKTSFPLIDSLIKYSKKEQINFQSADWMTLCSIEKNADFFLKQFLEGSISEKSIQLYHSIIKSQLLYELSNIQEDENINKYEYCSRNAIIKFFNDISNRSKKVNQTYIDFAHYYEMNIDKDFVISIPEFNYDDIVSLLINPIDFTPGPLFTDVVINSDDIEFLQNSYQHLRTNSLYDITKIYLSNNRIQISDLKSFDDIYSYIISKNAIESHIQNMVQTFFIANQISNITITKQDTLKLEFDDVPYEFDSNFIDKNPFSGFYLAFHPEVSPEIERIRKLAGESSFPLSLFTFRLYSNQDIVGIKLPSTFISGLNQEVEDFILNISTVVITNCKNGKITKFSNLIGFLLEQVPITFDTQQSEHFREILLDLVSKPKNQTLLKYILKYLQKNIEKMILVIGSNKWNELIVADFTMENNDLLDFLMNPWKIVLQNIKNDFETENKKFNDKILKIYDNISNPFSIKYSNRDFFNQVFDSMTKDSKKLQKKIHDEYIRLNEQMKEISEGNLENAQINKKWKKYCSYVINALNQMKDFPSITNGKFPDNNFFESFNKFFQDNHNVVHPSCDKEVTLIVFVLKDEQMKDVTVKYSRGNQHVEAKGTIKHISIMKLPSNLSVRDLNLDSKECDIYYHIIYYSSSVQPIEKFKMKDMEASFKEYENLLNQDSKSKNDDNVEGDIKILFKTHSFNEFKKYILEAANEIKNMIKPSGSMNDFASTSYNIMNKISEIENYFPVQFVDNSEKPTETIASLEQFVNFINQSKASLKEIHISEEIINADEQFNVDKKSEFQRILQCVEKFAESPMPKISEDTTQYKLDEMKCKNPEKLIIPTIFMDGNDFCINITKITAKLGPFYKGCPYTHLKFRIINFSKQKIKCTFQQDNKIIDLLYENNDGFFFLVFPIDKIAFNYDEDSEISFTGTISFYENNSVKPFGEVPYDITLFFLSPNMYLYVENFSFAIKDGDAQILPYYAIQNSDINIKAIPYFRQLKFVELPENTCKNPNKPTTDNNNTVNLVLPSLKVDETLLSMQLDFGLSYNMPVPVSLNLDLHDKIMTVLMHCDFKSDFVPNNPIITIGNSWRDFYLFISYYNPYSFPMKVDIDIYCQEDKNFEILKPKPIKFEPYSNNVDIFSFKARTIGNDFKRCYYQNRLTITIGEVSKIINFSLYLNKISYDKENHKIIAGKNYLKTFSYWDGNVFQNHNYRDEYQIRDVNLILSPFCIYFSQSNNVSLKYSDNGTLDSIYKPKLNPNTNTDQNHNISSSDLNNSNNTNYDKNIQLIEYEILTLYKDSKNGKINIKIINKKNCKQKEDELRLFARIKGKQDVVFPLFGESKKVEFKFDASTFNYHDKKYHFTKAFVDWFDEFLEEQDKKNVYILSDNDEFAYEENSYPSAFNFGYLIAFMIKYINDLPYKKLLNEVKNFTNSELFIEKYQKAFRGFNDLQWKLVSIVWALYETMVTEYRDLMAHHFIIDFPISSELLQKEQERLCKKCKIDKESMKKKSELQKKSNEAIVKYNNNKKNQFIKKGYAISSYIKWTFNNKFQEISKLEFPESDISKELKEEIIPEYSKEAGNIEISNISFENINSIMDIYKVFELILKNAYQFTISFHSSLEKNKNLSKIVGVLNQLISFYFWAKEIKYYSPYSSFFDKFFSAYQSMMIRLKSSGILIRSNHYVENKNNDNEFVIKPKYQNNIDTRLLANKFKQLGKNKKQTDNNVITESKIKQKDRCFDRNRFIYRPDSVSTPDYDIEINKFASPLSQGHGRNLINGEIIQKISRESITTASKEIPNKDYIDYIVNKMTNPSQENKYIPIFADDKSHIPDNYDIISSNIFTESVDYYFDAADSLTGLILDGLNDKPQILDNCDYCYSSILIDCSNTFSEIQKASLILISIAYGNALTALRIPYSIIIYCDDNFQFILKKLEENHDKLYFAKLIESMTVNRRMSSMSDAIQMAKLRVIPSPKGKYAKRTKHVIYVLSDGLSTILDIPQQWNQSILNNKLVTVSFFFLNIISGEFVQPVLNVWSKFAQGISKASSPTTVFYSTFDGILDNKEFYCVLSSIDKKQNKDSITKLVSLSECFGKPIMQSFSKNKNKYPNNIIKLNKEPKKLYSWAYDADKINLILSILDTQYSNEKKYYIDSSGSILLDEPFELEIYEMKIDSFSVNVNIGETQKSRELYSLFYKKLFDLSSKMTEQNSIQEMSTYVFVPNKPSQYTPSSDGTLFYFPGLIRFLLTQGQDTKIFLEKKAGLLKSYSVFVVIDCSISCFNIQSAYHAFQSLFVLLQTLSRIDLPSINIIITTSEGPIILCSEKSTLDALSSNSSIWLALFTHLLNPHPDSYLDSALLSALSIRAQEKTLSSILFVFTDGNFSATEQKINNSILERIISYNVEAVTIGIGSYSSNICSLNTKKVWSINPKNIIKAILAVFGKETNDLIEKIPSLYTNIPFDSSDIIIKLSSYLKFNSIDNYSFKELIMELNSITRDISVFKDFYNIKPDGKDEFSEDSSHDIGKMNYYKGIKILICQFWDKSMSKGENPKISKDVLLNGIDERKKSVINSLKEFEIETNIVQNYKAAISEIKSGEYSEVWVICGRHDGKMPDKSEWANLSSQFIDVLIIYWENGGGIVFWTDNSPLTAEVNFFLNKANFSENANEIKQVEFRIGGSYPGKKMLKKSKKPKPASFVSDQIIKCEGYDKILFNANMEKIYEGITIASAIIPPENAKSQCYDDENIKYEFAYSEDIKPFRFFSISSDGGISSLYYTSPINSKKGDIVIDCGFSKLFFELTEEGIYWYVRNIAIFMISIEKKASMIGGNADPRKVRPKAFEYIVKPYVNPEPGFYLYNDERTVDIVFLIDGTGSMRFFIDAVKSSCNDIAQSCQSQFPDNKFRFGCIIYRDNAVKEIRNMYAKYTYKNYNNDETEVSSLKSNINILYDFLSRVEPRGGGGDGPEDWISGYQRLRKMNWSKVGKKIVIHIADAGGHGPSFNSGYTIPHNNDGEEIDKNEYLKMENEHEHQFPEFIKWAANFGINFHCLSGSFASYKSFQATEKIYKKANGSQFKITRFHNYDGDNFNEDQKNRIIHIVKQIAKESVDDAIAVPEQPQNENDQFNNQNGIPPPYMPGQRNDQFNNQNRNHPYRPNQRNDQFNNNNIRRRNQH